jgi:hypothetical protein
VRVVYLRKRSQPALRLMAVGLQRWSDEAASLISRSNPIIVCALLPLITVVNAWMAATATAISLDLASASWNSRTTLSALAVGEDAAFREMAVRYCYCYCWGQDSNVHISRSLLSPGPSEVVANEDAANSNGVRAWKST